MFLKKLTIKNFRSIKSLDFSFNKGVNIFIGENNAGKTALIDVLRICLSYGNSWKDISVDFSDFHVDKSNTDAEPEDIEFHLFFSITKPEETGWFNELHAVAIDGSEDLQVHFNFYTTEVGDIKKIRRKVWGGSNEGHIIPSEVLDMFYYVYLEPLRDAVYHLRPVRGNKLGQLYLNLVTDEERRDTLAAKVKGALHEDEEWNNLVKDGKEKVNNHLFETAIKGKEQEVNIDFLPFEFKRIVENLRIQMPVFRQAVLNGDDNKQKYFDLYQNGLGYNNLIYTATVLGHLKQRATTEPSSYMALLIEEPEAHLHPQLQNIFFRYLDTLTNEQFQIFISSHSPTITAKAKLDSLIVLQNQDNVISSLSINNSGLSAINKKHLEKFLDVTKSQLFFANGSLLVEGISEALLLPVFAMMIGQEFDLDKKGIEIVNINGVAFEHFANLFNNADPLKRLSARCSIITDDDRDNGEDESPRAQKAIDLAGGVLKVFLGTVTFEYELFMAGNNSDILLSIFKKLKPNAAANIEPGESKETYAKAFVKKVKDNKAKSILAHELALQLEASAELRAGFTIPEYIKKAITWTINGE